MISTSGCSCGFQSFILRANSATEAKGQDYVDWLWPIKCLDNSDEKLLSEYKSSCIAVHVKNLKLQQR